MGREDAPLSEVAGATGAVSLPFVDLSLVDQLPELVTRAEAENGPIDVLVNNAGVLSAGHFARMGTAEIERLLRVNLESPILLTRLLLPGMLRMTRPMVIGEERGVFDHPDFDVLRSDGCQPKKASCSSASTTLTSEARSRAAASGS